MMSKLGLDQFKPGDEVLLQQLNEVLQSSEIDMTLFYRRLATWNNLFDESSLLSHFDAAIYKPDEFKSLSVEPLTDWLKLYSSRIDECTLESETRESRMNQVNPSMY